jgi:hypothetical protein
MIDEKHSGSPVRLTAQVTRMLAVLGVLVLLAGCAPQTGGGSGTTDDTADDEGDDESSGGNGVVDICNLIPDAALEAALGSPPSPDREIYRGSGETSCVIEGTGENARLSVTYNALGRDAFETTRGYVKDITDLYAPVPGLGEDAYRFGSEVTVLQGKHVVKIFLEGLMFDNVAEEDRLQRAINLAQEAVKSLP